MVEPLQPAGLDRQRVVLPDPLLHRLHQVAVALAAGARVRRGGAGALRAHRQRLPGRRHRPVRAPVGDDELRPLLRGRRREDDPRRARLRGRHVEPRGRHGRHGDVGADRAVPVPEPAREAEHGRARAATAAARATSACASPGRRRSTRCRTSGTGASSSRRGLWGGYPGATGYRHNVRGADLLAKAERGEPFPLHEPDPADSALLREIAGEHLFDIETTTLPEVYTRGRPLPVHVPRRDGRRRPARAAVRVGDGGHRGRVPARRATPSRSTASSPATPTPRTGAAEAAARGARPEGRAGARVDEERAAAHPRPRHDRAGAAHVRGVDAPVGASWAQEFREFWDLPDDFVFDVPTPEVDLALAIQAAAE